MHNSLFEFKSISECSSERGKTVHTTFLSLEQSIRVLVKLGKLCTILFLSLNQSRRTG